MGRCAAIKPSGERCKGPAAGPHGYCWSHAPENAGKRRMMASKAARSKPNREVRDIKEQLEDLTRRVLGEAGSERAPLETARAAVANQLINTRLRALEIERKIREAEEFAARIEALEAAHKIKGRGTRWG